MVDPVVTIRIAEEMLMGAMEYLAAMPDRERAFLAAGSRTAWPDIVRDVFDAYDAEAEPLARVHVGRREAALVERMLTGPEAAVLAVPVDQRGLLGRVLAGKLWGVPAKGGKVPFTREAMWEAERFRARRRGEKLGVACDGLIRRYERALGFVAVRLSGPPPVR